MYFAGDFKMEQVVERDCEISILADMQTWLDMALSNLL